MAPFGAHVVASIVPDGFAAYVRILHPAYDMNNQRIRWSQVAAESSRTMHRLVQFHAINRAPVSGSEVAARPPKNGNLASDLLRVAGAALAEHTSTPNSCWFCLWEGYGWLHDESTSTVEFRPAGTFVKPASTLADATGGERLSAALRAAVRNPLRVRLPQRDYLLFEGPLEAATELGWSFPNGVLVPQSPNLFWPDDRSWCVASEIDLFCTLVAGSTNLADRLMADPRLEAWRVFPDDPVTWDSDDQNL